MKSSFLRCSAFKARPVWVELVLVLMGSGSGSGSERSGRTETTKPTTEIEVQPLQQKKITIIITK